MYTFYGINKYNGRSNIVESIENNSTSLNNVFIDSILSKQTIEIDIKVRIFAFVGQMLSRDVACHVQ